MSRRRKGILAAILIFAALSAAAYGAGVFYFTGHFLPGTRIAGLDCSFRTVDEAAGLLAAKAGSYVLAVETRNNGVESITAQEAGLTYRSDGLLDFYMTEQEPALWFLSFGQEKDYELSSFVYDEQKLSLAVLNLDCMQTDQVVEPVDAYIYETEDGFAIAPEKEGAAPQAEKVFQAVADAFVSGNTTVNLEEAGCYKKPAVYRQDEGLLKNLRQITDLTQAYITYDFGDRKETVEKSLIKNWLKIDENGDCVLDSQKVAAYVGELGYKYDTFGSSRQFTTYDGRQITIDAGGDYGWVIDREAETKGLMEAIENQVVDVRQPVYLYSGKSRDTDDIGYTFVELDLTNQRMIFWKDGVPIVDTQVVTGNPNVEGCATPTGCFAVDAMESPAVLVGEDYQSDVTFWIPFAGNVGIHDASWRTEFGGDLYLWQGSHGCVNTPYEQAQIIYNNIEVGTAVVVYY